jgi:cytochrome c553
MKSRTAFRITLALAFVVTAGTLARATSFSPTAVAPTPVAADYEPVDNMHHLMEYIYGPIFGELKASQTNTDDENYWKTVKKTTLVIAEVTSLLAQRGPDGDNAKIWTDASQSLHNAAKATYQAGREKNQEGVTKNLALMQAGCKACHGTFKK